MGCGFLSGIAKYVLFFFNFAIVVCAIVLIAFGAINLVDADKGIDGFTSFSVGGFAIAVGVIIFFVAFFGCCGAIKQNSCMLTTYAAILLTLFILQVILGIMGFVAIRNGDNEFENDVTDLVKKLFDKYTKNTDDKDIIDDFQQDLECCGVKDPLYWSAQLGPSMVPDSCCAGSGACLIINAYRTGCGKAFTDLITDNISVIAGVAIGFGVVELLGAIFAFVVRNRD